MYKVIYKVDKNIRNVIYFITFIGYDKKLFSTYQTRGYYIGKTKQHLKDRIGQHLHTGGCTINKFIKRNDILTIVVNAIPSNDIDTMEHQAIQYFKENKNEKLLLNIQS